MRVVQDLISIPHQDQDQHTRGEPGASEPAPAETSHLTMLRGGGGGGVTKVLRVMRCYTDISPAIPPFIIV